MLSIIKICLILCLLASCETNPPSTTRKTQLIILQGIEQSKFLEK